MTGLTTVSIVGCGAVTSKYYLPALNACADRVDVIGVHDSDTARAEAVARQLPRARALASFEALLALGADLVVVASPPTAHALQTIAALKAGSHVLCEKPLAPSLAEATAMTETARAQGRILAVNMIRRHFPASRIAETLIRTGSFGTVRHISVFEGGPFAWPIADPTYFSAAVSGGGVLADVGTHVIDLLSWWFGEAQLVDYRDDAMGGVEANALMTLRCGGVPATLRLSRDWGRPNGIDIFFESAKLRWTAERLATLEITLPDRRTPLDFRDQALGGWTFEDSFAAQLNAVIDRLGGEQAHVVTAEQALSTVRLVERAYRERRPMEMPWLDDLRGRVDE